MKNLEIKVEPGFEQDLEHIKEKVKSAYQLSDEEVQNLSISKRSLDARNKPYYNIRCNLEPRAVSKFKKQDVKNKQEVHIIGAGPAGLFAALRLIELGFKPVIFERGKNVRDRRKDLAKLMKQGEINPESNYCYGEGGAGTFSDGKLYTRSGKRGSITHVLETFVQFGAEENIVIDAHPHIGTNKLPKIISAMTKTIIDCGGEVHFSTKVTDIIFSNKLVKKVITNHGEHDVKNLIIATGHSARDIFQLLESKNLKIEAKSFALGVRIEHPQEVINKIQYKKFSKTPLLPPASYSLVTQVQDKGVYTFCMCPGGIICPASTDNNEIVVNGWSPSTRGSYFANSGLVVEIPVEESLSITDKSFHNAYYTGQNLRALNFQSSVEKKAFEAGGGKFKAPAQRVVDLIKNKTSDILPRSSYKPGLTPSDLSHVLPPYVYKKLHQALKVFIEKNPLYGSEDAILVGVESRTSSPVKIPRNEKCQHIEISNLYPCGEGAGYAGGIVSAAMDGIRIAESISQ